MDGFKEEKEPGWGEYLALALFMCLGFLPGYLYGGDVGREDALVFARDAAAQCERSASTDGYTHTNAVDDYPTATECLIAAIDDAESEKREDERLEGLASAGEN